jgi:hypothetical protein
MNNDKVIWIPTKALRQRGRFNERQLIAFGSSGAPSPYHV